MKESTAVSIRELRAPTGLLALALAISVALAGLALPAGSAQAHANYERSEPAEGAVVAEPPERVDVWFTQEMRRSGGLPTMVVVNQSGDIVSFETVLDDEDRTHMYVELPPALPPGRYTVIWHTLSDEDGEEAQGAFHFFIGEGPGETPSPPDQETPAATPEPVEETPGPSPPDAGPTPTPATPPAPEEVPEDDGGGLPVWALIAGVVGGLVVGGGAGALMGRRRGA